MERFPGIGGSGNERSGLQGVQEPGAKARNPATGREAVRLQGGEGPPGGVLPEVKVPDRRWSPPVPNGWSLRKFFNFKTKGGVGGFFKSYEGDYP